MRQRIKRKGAGGCLAGLALLIGLLWLALPGPALALDENCPMSHPPKTTQLTVNVNDNGNISTAAIYTMDELRAMKQERKNYSCVDLMPAGKYISAEGIMLNDLLTAAGVDINSITEYRFLSTDGALRIFSREEFMDTPRYYYPNLYLDYKDVGGFYEFQRTRGDDASAVLIEPMLALKHYAIRWNREGQWAKMDDEGSIRLCFGQTAPDDITAPIAAFGVEKIEVKGKKLPASTSTSAPLAPAADNSQCRVSTQNGRATVVPSAGGIIGLGGEATLNIPAGALKGTAGLEVAVSKVGSPSAAPDGFTRLSPVFACTVDGQTGYEPAAPVILTLAFEPSSVPAGETPAVYAFDEAASWVRLGGSLSGQALAVDVEQFKQYAVFAALKGSAAETPARADTFSDIAGHWAEDSIKRLVAPGDFGGDRDSGFKPDAAITRGEFITVLVKALQLPPGESSSFADTKGHWAADNIAAAVAHGIAGGYDDSTFRPDDLITREQMAVLIVRAAGLAPSPGEVRFADGADISPWAKDAVVAVVKNGIMSEYPDHTFNPRGHASRAEGVTVAANAFKE